MLPLCSPGARPAARRVAVVVAALVTALIALAVPASAHADFLEADPGPGTGLPQAPGAVVLRFTEPLVADLSEVRVLDEAGDDVGRGPAQPVAGDAAALRRELGLLPPGTYEVAWKTVSPLDGHTLRGRYTFAVGARASSQTVVAAGPLDSEGAVGVAGRHLALAGLALWSGLIVLRRRAAALGLPPRRLAWLERAAPAATALGSLLALVGAVGIDGAGTLLATPNGGARSVTVAAALLALAAAGRRRAGPTAWAALGGVALLGDVAAGHAASAAAPLYAGALLTVHVVAAGVWLAALLLALLSADGIGTTLRAFAKPAVGAAVTVAASGLLASAELLGHPRDLLATGYGRTVLAKVALMAGMGGLGLVHRHRRRQDRGSAALRRPVGMEVTAGVVVLLLAAALVSFPDAPGQAEAASADEVLVASTGQHDSLSLGGATGHFVVGLTVAPPRPGRVDLTVTVTGTEPGDGVRDIAVEATGPDGATVAVTDLRPCGRDCVTGSADLDRRGTWRLAATFASNEGPQRVAVEAPLPAADGQRLLRDSVAAMERLDGVAVVERLREEVGGVELRSDYTFRAPDAMRWIVRGGSGRVAIDDRGWQRRDPDAAWEAFDWPAPGFVWPDGFYAQFFRDAAAVRVLGADEVDGHAVTVVAFVQPAFPIWYRAWIDDETRVVRRLQMRTENHLMDHRYRDFDADLEVSAPTAAPVSRGRSRRPTSGAAESGPRA